MLALAEQLNDPIRQQDAKIALIDYGYLVNPLAIIEPARLAVESAARLDDPRRHGEALFHYGEAERVLSHLPEARQALEQAAACFKEAGLLAQEARCYHTLALVFYSGGDFGQGRVLAERALALSRAAGDRKQEAVSLRRNGLIYLEQELIGEAEEMLREALALNRLIGDRFEETMSLLNLGDCLIRQGNFEEGDRLSYEALQIAEAIQSYGGISRATIHLEETFRHRGQFEAAILMVEDQIRRFSHYDNLLLNTNLKAILSDLLASIGQYEEAFETAQPLLEFLENLDSDKTQADVYSFMAWLKINLNELDRARQVLDLALPKAELGGVPFILASVQLVTGELALRVGSEKDLLQGLDLVEQALGVLSTSGDKLRFAIALGLAARICLALDRPHRALEYSSRAMQIAESIHTNSELESYTYAHAMSLHANNLDQQARVVLQRAYERILFVAGNTTLDSYRQGWLENVQINRAIQQAWLDWGRLENG